jgi:hypothetical protein
MRCFASVLLVLALVATSWANPVPDPDALEIYLDDGGQCLWPSYAEIFTATIFVNLNRLPSGFGEELGAVAFRLERSFGGFLVEETNLLVGGGSIGEIEGDGIIYLSSTECTPPNEYGLVPVVQLEYLYTGEPGLVELMQHPLEFDAVYNCDGDLYHWYAMAHSVLGIGVPNPDGCGAAPIESASWGAIKGLYRER